MDVWLHTHVALMWTRQVICSGTALRLRLRLTGDVALLRATLRLLQDHHSGGVLDLDVSARLLATASIPATEWPAHVRNLHFTSTLCLLPPPVLAAHWLPAAIDTLHMRLDTLNVWDLCIAIANAPIRRLLRLDARNAPICNATHALPRLRRRLPRVLWREAVATSS